MNMTKNSRHIITIDNLSPEGQGVGMLEGIPVIVDRALPGETVAIKVIKAAQSYVAGRLVQIITSSADRTAPFCRVFRRCGGCSLQHLAYPAQLRLKMQRLQETLAREGPLAAIPIRPMHGMKMPRHYRYKAQYPIGFQHKEIRIGFYTRRSHEIIEHDTCDVQPEVMTRIRDIIREFLVTRQVSVYDEVQHSGLVRHLMIRQGYATGEIMIVLVINGETLPYRTELIESLTRHIPAIKSIVLNRNTEKTNVILGKHSDVSFGKLSISDTLGGYWFEISPHAFYQVNPAQTEILYQHVLEYADLQGHDTVIDLYCGIGTIALFSARHARKVYGIDVVPAAIANAKRNAARNAVDNVEFFTGTAEQVVADMIHQGIRANVVVVDPPRKGCEQNVLNLLVELSPQRIVYVSCHPKTLTRDVRCLTTHGFRCTEIQPVDMFPHTMHVECVANIIRA